MHTDDGAADTESVGSATVAAGGEVAMEEMLCGAREGEMEGLAVVTAVGGVAAALVTVEVDSATLRFDNGYKLKRSAKRTRET